MAAFLAGVFHPAMVHLRANAIGRTALTAFHVQPGLALRDDHVPCDRLRARRLKKPALLERLAGPIVTYSYEKRMSKGVVVVCEVRVFPLEVKHQNAEWPEREERTCRWFSAAEAAKVVQERDLGNIILNIAVMATSKQVR
jgi:hypothetical protein